MATGVSRHDDVVRALVEARSTVDVGTIAQTEIRSANGQGSTVDFSRGDLRAVKSLALAAIHWARLHPDVPLSNLSVGKVHNPQSMAEARIDARDVRFSDRYFGERTYNPVALAEAMSSAPWFRGKKRFADAHIALHELEHLRHLSRLMPGYHPPADAYNRDVDTPALPQLLSKTAIGLNEKLTADLPIDPNDVAKHLGTYANTNHSERTAEAGAHLHLFGARAPQVAKQSVAVLGQVDAVAAAAPALRDALKYLDGRVDPLTGQHQLNPVELLRKVFRRADRERPVSANPWLASAAAAQGPAEPPTNATGAAPTTGPPAGAAPPASGPPEPPPTTPTDSSAHTALRGLSSPGAAPTAATDAGVVARPPVTPARAVERQARAIGD